MLVEIWEENVWEKTKHKLPVLKIMGDKIVTLANFVQKDAEGQVLAAQPKHQLHQE